MAGQNRIKFDVEFNVRQEQLNSLQTELQKITHIFDSAKAGTSKFPLTKELEEAGRTAQKLSSIIDRSFNKDLGTANITKFNQLLKQSGLNLNQVKSSLEAQGSIGAAAWNRLSSSIMSTNIQIKQSNKLLNDMATTMTNTLKWGLASSILNTMTNSIKQAYNYSVQLDTSLNDIRIVTGDSADQMQRFAEQANQAAERLGSTTLDYTKTALGFYQQGLDDRAVAERTEASIKAANVTGTQAAQTAEYLTAVWNGFQAEIGTETEYVDKLAAVADSSASNLAELATAMSKTASVANNMGVNMDQLTAQVATVIATTRQAPETVGNAFKTIYARINDVKTGSEDAEVSLGNYTKIMGQLGYNVLDASGSLRDSGEVMQEIGDNWANMTREQQIYLAQTMAGKRQMNNLIALFDNWEKYSTLLNTSLEAQGTLDEKNNRYLESTRAHLNELKTAYQDLYSTLINSNEVNAGIDTIKNLVSTIDGFLEGFGGGIASITAFGSIVAFVFREQIGQAIGEARLRSEQFEANLQRVSTIASTVSLGPSGQADTAAGAGAYANQQAQSAIAERLLSVQQGLTQEQANQVIELQTQIGLEAEKAAQAEFELNAQKQIMAGENEIARQKIEQVQTGQSYVAIMEEIIAEEMQYGQTETASLESQQAKLQALEQQIASGVYLNEQGEELVYSDKLHAKILAEKERIEQNIARLKAAQTAEVERAKGKEATQTGEQLQSRVDVTLDGAETIAYARAQTNLLTASFSSLTMVIGTASSLIRTWGDENASVMDKVTRTIMAAGFAIPMLIQNYKTLTTAIDVLVVKKGLLTSAEVAENTALTTKIGLLLKSTASRVKETLADRAAAASKELQLAGIQKENAQKLIGKAISEAKIASQLKENAATLTGAAADEAEAAAEVAATTAKYAGTAATESLAIATGHLAGAVYALLGPVGLVVVALGTLVGVGYAVSKAYDAQKDRAREAAQAASDAKDRAQEATDKYNNLKTALDELKDGQSILKGLTKGTTEWAEAVMNLNEKMLSLLDTYPELAQFLTNKDGILTLDEDGEKALTDIYMQKAQAAQNSAISARANAAEQQGLYEAQQLGREVGTGITTSPDDILRAAQVFAEHAGEINDKNADSAAILAKYANIKESDAEKLLQNTSALLELNATAQGIVALESNRASVNLQDNERYQEADDKEKAKIEELYNKKYDEAYNNYKDKYNEHYSAKEGTGYTKEQLADIYADLTGITYTEEQLKDIKKEQLADDIANAKAAQDLQKEENNIVADGIDIVKRARSNMEDWEREAEAIQGKFADITPVDTEEYGKTKSAIEKAETGSIDGDDATAIQNMLVANGKNMSDYFTMMGDGSYKLKVSAEEWQRVANSLSTEPFKEQIRKAQEQLDAITGIEKFGEEGITQKQTSAEGQQAQIDFLAASDFTDTDFLGKLQDSLNNGGLDEDQMRQLAEACREAADEYDAVISKKKELAETTTQTQQQLANEANNIEELNNQYAEGLITREQYNEALIAHGANEDVNAEYVRKYTEALAENAEELEYVDDALQDNEEAATGVAAVIEDAIEGIEAIQDAWEDWTDRGLETPEVLEEVSDVLSDMFNQDVDGDFVLDHLEEVERLAQGDVSALTDLGIAMAEATMNEVQVPAFIDKTQWEADKTSLFEDINNFNWEDIQVGASIDDLPFYNALQQMIIDSGMAQEDINAFLGGIGYNPHVEYVTVPISNFQQAENGGGYTISAQLSDGQTVQTTVSEDFYNAHKNEDSVKIPIIKGSTFANRAAGARNLGGNRTSPGGGGGGGGKGKPKKGGGKGKEYKPPKKKETKKDPYAKVNRQLKDAERNLKELTQEEKKLTGEKYLKNLQKQNAELKKQLDYTREKNKIAADEVRRQQKALAKTGLNFADDGEITNYLAMWEKYNKELERLYKKATAKGATEADKARYEKATEDFDKWEKAVADYNKDLDIFKDTYNEYNDIIDEMVENNIKRFNYTIDLKLDTTDFEKEWKKFKKDVLLDIKDDDYVNLNVFGLSTMRDDLDAAKSALDHVKEMQKQLKASQKIQALIAERDNPKTSARRRKEIATEIKKLSSQTPYYDNVAQLEEDMKKYMEEAMKRGEDIADAVEDIHDNWMDAIDDTQEAFDKQLEQYESINELIEHNLDLVELLYGDEAYEEMSKLYEQQAENTAKAAVDSKKQQDFWKKQMDSVEKGSDAWNEYKKNWEDAVSETNKLTVESAKLFKEQYDAAIQGIGKTLTDNLMGGDAYKANRNWENMLGDSDRYLDTLDRGNNMLALYNKGQDMMMNRTAKQQKELQKLMNSQTKNLENQTELRQIDFEIAQAELDLLEKRWALEDARNNKTKMRLRRDSQGNYRYQYVVDEDAVNKAQQEYMDALADLRAKEIEDYKDTASRFADAYEDYLERVNEIREQYAGDEAKISQEIQAYEKEWLARNQKLVNDYDEMSRKVVDINGTMFNSLAEQMSDEQLQKAMGVSDAIFGTLKDIYQPDGEIVSMVDGFASEIFKKSFDTIPQKTKETLQEVTGLIPQVFGDVLNSDDWKNQVHNATKEITKAVFGEGYDLQRLADAVGQNFNDLVTNLDSTVELSESFLSNQRQLNNLYSKQLETLKQQEETAQNVLNMFRDAVADNKLPGIVGQYINRNAGTPNNEGYVDNNYADANGYDTLAGAIYAAASKAEGGNTGSWAGGKGKFAVLHADEYVLTEQDTKNVLNSINIAEALAQQISALQTGMLGNIGGAVNFSKIFGEEGNSSLFDQNVVINADFPAVESAREIKQAFDELVNMASQKVSKNRRVY